MSAWLIPLQNAQRPDTTTPPSPDFAVPRGAHTPAATPRPHPRRDTPPAAEHLLAAGRRQVGDQQGAGDGDRYAPSRGGVTARNRFGAPQRRFRRQLQRLDLAGHGGAQQSGRIQAGNEFVGESAIAIDLPGKLASREGDLLGKVLDLGVAVIHQRLLVTVTAAVQSTYSCRFSN